MTAQEAQPLPECLGCEKPTRRDVYGANHGLCSSCRADLVDLRQGRYIGIRRSRP